VDSGFTVNQNLHNGVNNGASAYQLSPGAGATCIVVSRTAGATTDTMLFSFYEFAAGSGASIALDATATQIGNLSITGNTATGQAVTTSGRNDVILEVCACGPTMTGVTSPLNTHAFFLDHIADSYLLNQTSGLAAPAWSNGSSITTSVGATIGFTD
jgi:hypothetical protein